MSDRDKLIILSILEAIDKIHRFASNYSNPDEFRNNERDFDACMMNFIIIGEMVSRLSNKFIEQYSHIDWYKIKGFRNIIAHDYFGIDAEEVWQILSKHLPQLKKQLQLIINDNKSN